MIFDDTTAYLTQQELDTLPVFAKNLPHPLRIQANPWKFATEDGWLLMCYVLDEGGRSCHVRQWKVDLKISGLMDRIGGEVCTRCEGDGKAHGADRPFEGPPGKCPVCKGTGRKP